MAPTGTIVFRLYGPSGPVVCNAGNLVFTSAPITVNGNGSYGPSGSFTPTVAGTYRWIATYSGDANNAGIAGVCGAANETVVITKATPGLATVASAGGVLGVSVNDTATISNGLSPTGTIIFRLYGPSDTAVCTDANLVFTSAPITVNGNASYGPSGSFTPTAPGTYRGARPIRATPTTTPSPARAARRTKRSSSRRLPARFPRWAPRPRQADRSAPC